MRVFVAIELQEEVKGYLSRIQQIAVRHSSRGNFTARDNLHLTVRFIGEVDLSLLSEIKAAITAAAGEIKPFDLYTAGLGYFPRKNRVILWTGVKGDITSLRQLYAGVEKHLVRIGIPQEDRGYTPHLTLGREIVLNSSVEAIEGELRFETKSIIVQRLSLMDSCREDGKLVYRPIYVCPLMK